MQGGKEMEEELSQTVNNRKQLVFNQTKYISTPAATFAVNYPSTYTKSTTFGSA